MYFTDLYQRDLGCYHCSQRRIDCDRGQPACIKCVSKGLLCSGLGVRYRFNLGVAARGKLMGKSMPMGDGPSGIPPSIHIPQIRWASELAGCPEKSESTKWASKDSITSRGSVNSDISPNPLQARIPEPDKVSFQSITEDLDDLDASECCSKFVLKAMSTEHHYPAITMVTGSLREPSYLQHNLETHNSLTRMLFSNCTSICPHPILLELTQASFRDGCVGNGSL